MRRFPTVRNCDCARLSIADTTLASASVARWCVGAKAETAGGVFQVREDEPEPGRDGRLEGEAATSSQRTLPWRDRDSNSQSPLSRRLFSPLQHFPFRRKARLVFCEGDRRFESASLQRGVRITHSLTRSTMLGAAASRGGTFVFRVILKSP
jgi:hypothetical protein